MRNSSNTRNKNWQREELILAFNLYCKTPFTKINASNNAVKELAPIIGRSASAVALKLANFARLDPALQERNISGMSHGSKGEAEIWKEFNDNWAGLAYQSEMILAKYQNEYVEDSSKIAREDLPMEGKEREIIIRTRVNQSFFRKTILASYDNRCCVTGISRAELLVASHIVPWAQNENSRMNPGNGLCLNALHDKAFDRGLITVTPEYLLKVSDELYDSKQDLTNNFFIPYQNRKIELPQKFLPSREFLEYHNKNIFIG